MSDAAFTKKGAGALVAVAVVSLMAAALLGIFGDVLSEPASFGADVYSRSAIGHRAFAELLRRLGFPLVISRNRTAEKMNEDAVLVVAEPRLEQGSGTHRGFFEAMMRFSPNLVVVLPKRTGPPDPAHPHWLGATELLPISEPQQVLDALELEGKVIRTTRSSPWRGVLPTPSLADPQLLQGSNLEPLLEAEDGVLVGALTREGMQLIVLADPDLIASHGLGTGNNSVIAVRMLERLGVGSSGAIPVVLDETLHGYSIEPSIFRELFSFPLSLAALQVLVAAGLLSWAALVRFGRPARAAPVLGPGKAFLVENTADLLLYGRHLHHAVSAYLRAAKETVAHRLRLPGDRADTLDGWVARVAMARGKGEVLAELDLRAHEQPDEGRGSEESAVRTAQAIYEFREEMTDGADRDSGRHRAAAG